MRANLMALGLVLATLPGCGTCIGASCGDFSDAAPGTHNATVMDQASGVDTGGAEPYIDETATFEYTGSEAVLTYADEAGNTWEVRYTTSPMEPGA